MQIKVTQTFILETIHEVDLTNKEHDYDIGTIIGLCSERVVHTGCDALRAIDSIHFTTLTAHATNEKRSTEIVKCENVK